MTLANLWLNVTKIEKGEKTYGRKSKMIDGLIKISKAGIWFSISGMLIVALIYCIWGLGEDIYSEFEEQKISTAYGKYGD